MMNQWIDGWREACGARARLGTRRTTDWLYWRGVGRLALHEHGVIELTAAPAVRAHKPGGLGRASRLAGSSGRRSRNRAVRSFLSQKDERQIIFIPPWR